MITKFTVHAVEAIVNEYVLILVFLRNLKNSLGLNVYETSLEDEIVASVLMEF